MTTEADRMARARLEFTEAMERGCSIPELRRIKARERQMQAEARLAARRNCGRAVQHPARDSSPRSPFLDGQDTRTEPWMMRD